MVRTSTQLATDCRFMELQKEIAISSGESEYEHIFNDLRWKNTEVKRLADIELAKTESVQNEQKPVENPLQEITEHDFDTLFAQVNDLTEGIVISETRLMF